MLRYLLGNKIFEVNNGQYVLSGRWWWGILYAICISIEISYIGFWLINASPADILTGVLFTIRGLLHISSIPLGTVYGVACFIALYLLVNDCIGVNESYRVVKIRKDGAILSIKGIHKTRKYDLHDMDFFVLKTTKKFSVIRLRLRLKKYRNSYFQRKYDYIMAPEYIRLSARSPGYLQLLAYFEETGLNIHETRKKQ